jgi:hypothetical protein
MDFMLLIIQEFMMKTRSIFSKLLAAYGPGGVALEFAKIRLNVKGGDAATYHKVTKEMVMFLAEFFTNNKSPLGREVMGEITELEEFVRHCLNGINSVKSGE